MEKMITILGPTACGKTAVATRLAALFATEREASRVSGGFPAEIISADSRQVFRGMDIGTGKDLADYEVTIHRGGREERLHIPYHLIDIAEAGTKYSVFHFQRDFMRAYIDIGSRTRVPILCGGTGLYIESVLRGYNLVEVPVNPDLRNKLEGKTLEELTAILATYKRLHNTTDVDTARRAIRAIEIEEYYRQNRIEDTQPFPNLASLTIGLDVPRDIRRQRITQRLQRRLQDEDMTGEVRRLLQSGVPAEALISYGLEYRYITLHLLGQLSFEEMARQLEIAIHQFAKRQMTYFRGMERRGVSIHWIDATRPPEDIADEIFQLFLASFEENL
ncbi:MAG: tRNA (adenosine(37)-N6)-dimethylallyltransferase MiaA [Bacteroidaceae bacterium]|nr:tRNA (adenosine(37)-N6)-dimethylallyltransferase MiaA [Bacteroidaceae bacterium]